VLHQHRELAYTVPGQNLPCAFDDCSESDDESEDERHDDEEQKSGAGQNKEGSEAPKEMEEFEFGFTNTPINQSKHPLISKSVGEKDEITRGMVNVLIWELLALPSITNRKVAFDFVYNTQGCLVNVPTHTSENGSLATAGHKGDKWLETILSQVAVNLEDGVQLICTYISKNYEGVFKTSAT
jgi:hypothetical protein